MAKTVSAIYDNHESASYAIDILKSNGFNERELTVLASEASVDKNIALEEHSKAPEGVSIGASIGAASGATLAGLTAVGTLTGGAGLLAAGPIVAMLAGAGAGAGVGGLLGGLIGVGIPETEAKFIDEELGKGHVMLGVSLEGHDKDRVKDILQKTKPGKITFH